jgi:hypothetical protein
MSKLQTVDGSVLVSKETIAKLIRFCNPRELGNTDTMYDVGMEQAKAKMARLLQQEFQIDMNLNPAPELLRMLK